MHTICTTEDLSGVLRNAHTRNVAIAFADDIAHELGLEMAGYCAAQR